MIRLALIAGGALALYGCLDSEAATALVSAAWGQICHTLRYM